MNRKCFRVACLLAATTVFASCGNDDAIDNGGNTAQESTQVITLAVANTGDNFLATRAARPLYSSAAMQDIKTVKVVIYQLQNSLPESVTTNEGLTETMLNGMTLYGAKTIVAQKVFDPWMNNAVSNEYSNTSYGNGRQASWTLAAADQITQEGVYMAYAVGYNVDEYTALGASSSFHTTSKNGNFTFPLTIAQNTAAEGDVAPKVYEVFAGSAPFVVTKKQVTEDGSDYSYQFNVALTLHRQVAGTIGYFTNIPLKGNADYADKTGTKLRLVASNRCDNAVFAGFNSAYTGDAGKPSTTNVKYVVNGYDSETKTQTANAKFYGSASNDAYTVYEVELNKWFTGKDIDSNEKMDTNEDGMLNASDTWTNPLDTENKTPGVRKGCVLGSSFLFPFAMDGTKPTFQLQLLDSEGTVIRYWNIRLQTSSSADSQIGQKASLVSAAGVVTENSVEENFVNYSVLRNHLYNIGSRNAGDGGGSTDTESSTDDKAQPLNNETLILRVNDNWEAIHEMDID